MNILVEHEIRKPENFSFHATNIDAWINRKFGAVRCHLDKGGNLVLRKHVYSGPGKEGTATTEVVNLLVKIENAIREKVAHVEETRLFVLA